MEALHIGKHNPKRIVQLNSDLKRVETSSRWLREMLAHVTQYVDDVLVSTLMSSNLRKFAKIVNISYIL